MNFTLAISGKEIRFVEEKDKKVFVKEGARKLQISDLQRGFDLYAKGIEARERFVFNSYCLHHIDFAEDDVVIDCGANYGDLFLRLSKCINATGYYAFEPNPKDFQALRSNVGGEANLFNSALGNSNDELAFFVSTTGGDSSLVEPKEWEEKIDVSVTRLDSFLQEKGLKFIKLLKVEAEGYEPEILEGLGDAIRFCEYIAIDGGYERGRNSEQTFTACANYLALNGFELVDIYFPWCRALFQRKKRFAEHKAC